MTPDPSILEAALGVLPHGPEFRFLDRLLSLDPGKEAVGEYVVKGDDSFLKGHFPGDPIFPGVLLVEAAAQLAGVIAQSDPTHPPLPGLKLTALNRVKILGTARPGETLRIEASLSGRFGMLVQSEARVLVADRVVLSLSLTLAGTELTLNQ